MQVPSVQVLVSPVGIADLIACILCFSTWPLSDDRQLTDGLIQSSIGRVITSLEPYQEFLTTIQQFF